MLSRIRQAARRVRLELGVYRRVLRDPRTPWLARWLLGIAVVYAVSPIDLIPDAIPILGYLDDLLILPGLVYLALRIIPPDVIADCRKAAEEVPGCNACAPVAHLPGFRFSRLWRASMSDRPTESPCLPKPGKHGTRHATKRGDSATP